MTPEELNALRTEHNAMCIYEEIIYRSMLRLEEKFRGDKEVIRESLFRVRHEIAELGTKIMRAEAERGADDL